MFLELIDLALGTDWAGGNGLELGKVHRFGRGFPVFRAVAEIDLQAHDSVLVLPEGPQTIPYLQQFSI